MNGEERNLLPLASKHTEEWHQAKHQAIALPIIQCN
jgi:hypothetical protein